MSEIIRVLIVDDLPETRENVRKLLQFEPDVEVVDQAGDGNQAIAKAREHEPDVVLMDINMPGLDGISASQAIVRAVPKAQVIIMSVQSEADYLRRAMLAGARDFLMKPFSGDELMAAIRRVYETRPALAPTRTAAQAGAADTADASVKTGKILSVYSPKGGSGCTTVAINIAVALASRGHKTALLDASLQFGDIAVNLNMKPTTSIVDLMERIEELEEDLISSVMLKHQSGLKVLLAPPKPEMAELISAVHMDTILERLTHLFDFVVVDTPSGLNEVTLSVLDASQRIVLVTQQSIASLTNARRFFDLIDDLNISSKKIMLVVNSASDKFGISVKNVADALKRPIAAAISYDVYTVTNSADRGQPVVTTSKGKRDGVGATLLKLTNNIEKEMVTEDDEKGSGDGQGEEKKSLLGRLFG